MAEIKIQVSDKLIDEATKKELKALRSQVTRLKNTNTDLQKQLKDNIDVVERAERLVMVIKDAGNFTDLENYGGC